MQTGFIGLGDLGSWLVANLVYADIGPLTVFDVNPTAMAGLPASRATAAPSVGEVARAATDVVGVCVRNDAQLRDVVSGTAGLLAAPMRAGSVIVVHSTVHPETCRELAAEAEAVGVGLIDAGISKTGSLVIVGGDESTVERCRPYLHGLVQNVEYAGQLGSGLVVKLIRNLVMVATMGITAEALRCGEQLGVDRDVLIRSLQAGDGFTALRTFLATDRAVHSHPILSKDVSIAIEELVVGGCDVSTLRTSSDVGLSALGAKAAGH